MQVSKASIKSPEAFDPDEDLNRTTASILHSLPLAGENHFLTSAFIWGYNDSEEHQENSFALESNLQIDKLAIYGRYENIEKSSEALLLDQFEENKLFKINAITLGLNYTILRHVKTNFSLGAQGTLYSAESALDPIYGKNPMSVEIYLRVSPTLMKMMKH